MKNRKPQAVENRKEKAVKYRLEKLNQVQYADDELHRKELEAKGFQIVSKADPGPESFEAENSVKKPEAEKKARTAKKTGPASKAKAAEGEEKDAG